MKAYNIYFQDENQKIDYGIIMAESEFKAIETIVSQDEQRTQYTSIDDIHLRHYGMHADEVTEEKLLSVPEVNERIEELTKDFEILQEKYKMQQKFGVTFKFKNKKNEFYSIFTAFKEDMFKDDYPIELEFNFDQKLLAYWITLCNSYLQKNHTQQGLVHEPVNTATIPGTDS